MLNLNDKTSYNHSELSIVNLVHCQGEAHALHSAWVVYNITERPPPSPISGNPYPHAPFSLLLIHTVTQPSFQLNPTPPCFYSPWLPMIMPPLSSSTYQFPASASPTFSLPTGLHLPINSSLPTWFIPLAASSYLTPSPHLYILAISPLDSQS